MKRSIIYLDTSVISLLDQHDSPERMQETQRLWRKIMAEDFIVCVSDVTMEEIDRCDAPKRAKLHEYLNSVTILHLEETQEAIALTDKYLESGILKQKSLNDCRHLAIASVHECDYIVSWNFEHFVNVKTKNMVRGVNQLCGYRQPEIVAPPELLDEED